MKPEQIKSFIESKVNEQNRYVKIEFSKREPMYGLFLIGDDYKDLSSKNFWRIVSGKHFDDYNRTGNTGLARIFNGAEFSRLSLLNDEF